MKHSTLSSSPNSGNTLVSGSFFRYEIVEYATIGMDGDFTSPSYPNPKVVLREFNLWKETPKGYWIGYGHSNWTGKMKGFGHWVSKTAKKRYAYPTKDEALNNFIKRNERRVKILSRQVTVCKMAIAEATRMLSANCH